MASYKNRKKTSILEKGKKVLTILLSLVIIVPVLVHLAKQFLPGKGRKEFQSDIEFIAFQLAEKMGTIYPSWDPRSWVEDDQGVVTLIEKNQGNYSAIASHYNQLVKSRLSEDIVKYVDDYSTIAHII